MHIPNFRAEGVTSISPPIGLNAASWAATSVSKASGLCPPAWFPLGLSSLWSGSCSSNTAISYKNPTTLITSWGTYIIRILYLVDWDLYLVLKKMVSENLKL